MDRATSDNTTPTIPSAVAGVAREGQIYVKGHRVRDLRVALPVRAGAERYATRPLQAITMVVVHYSGVEADSSAEAIANYQTGKREGDPFPEIAYHFVVRQNGDVEQCHDLMVRTWHSGTTGNDRGVAVCLPMLSGPTPVQADAAACLIAAIAARLGRGLKIVGHQDLSATACPGPDWPKWKKKLTRPSGGDPPQVVVDGVPVKWAFCDWYRKLEALKPGLCGAPLGPHVVAGDGSARQAFAGCEMHWRDGEMWLRLNGAADKKGAKQ